jgi:hypothetical protein
MPEIHWPQRHSLIPPKSALPGATVSEQSGEPLLTGRKLRVKTSKPGGRINSTRDEHSLCRSLQWRFYAEDLVGILETTLDFLS